MRCRRAQAHIALLVGDDLDEPTLSRLRDHLDRCPPCQDHARQMRDVLDVLAGRPDAAAGGGDSSLDESLWPRLSRQLPKVARGTLPAADFNGWYPALAVAAVCLLIVTAAREVPQPAVTGAGANGAGAEVSPLWSIGPGVAPEPVRVNPGRVNPGRLEPVRLNPGGLGFPAAEAPADGMGPGMPAPGPFEVYENGTMFDGGGLGPADPLMIYTDGR